MDMVKKMLPMIALLLSLGVHAQTQQTWVAKNLSADEFKQQMDERQDEQILDVRTPYEWKSGTIAGAVKANFFDEGFEKEIEKLDKDRAVMVYCASGGRSSEAMEKLREKGFKEIYNLEGGIQEWQEAGYEMVK